MLHAGDDQIGLAVVVHVPDGDILGAAGNGDWGARRGLEERLRVLGGTQHDRDRAGTRDESQPVEG